MKKKRVGRPKKRGPKKKRKYISKKPKIDGRTLVSHRKYYNYKIITCHNKSQVKVLKKFEDIHDAYKELNRLKDLNKSIVFRRVTSVSGEISRSNDEYLLLEKNTTGDKKNIMLRNGLGKFTEVETTSNDWVIIDSAPMYVEETFYVYGFDSKRERKTFSWIYENVILDNIQSRFDIKRILVYKNKLVIKNDDSTFDIIFCKCEGDAIKFYNKLYELVKKTKQKQIYFIGSYSEISEKRKKIEEELIRYTGFSRKKIQMNGTDYH